MGGGAVPAATFPPGGAGPARPGGTSAAPVGVVAEAGPELIEQVGGRTIVTPLTDTARNTPVSRDKGGHKTEVNVKIEHFHNER